MPQLLFSLSDGLVSRGFCRIIARGSLQEDGFGDLVVGIVRVEIDGRVQAVPEAVDVGGVGVHVLAQRVGMLDQQAQRLRVVGRLQRASRGEHRAQVLTARATGWIGSAATHNDRLQDRLQPLVRGVCGGHTRHGRTSA